MIRETLGLTERPFGVNLILHVPPEDTEQRLEICLEEGAPIICFFWNDPSPYIERAHSAGALVTHTVASAAEARRVVDAGVDIVIAQGWEAGAHVWGEVATFPLVPRVVDAVAPTPVVAAGGIADGRGLAAALALGAAGAWVGTRFTVSEESNAHPDFKELIIQAAETDTVYSYLFDGGWPDAPGRTLRNSTFNNWEAAGHPTRGQRPGEGEIVATRQDGRPPVARYDQPLPLAGMTGDMEAMPLWAGQSAGLVSRMQPAGEIVMELVDEAVRVIRPCNGLVRSEA